MTPKKLDEMSVGELGEFCDQAAARVLFGSPSQVCPKCASANAIEVAQRMLSELGRPVPERHAAAYGHLETVLDMFTRLRLVLCGRHAAEFFRQHAASSLFASAEGMAPPNCSECGGGSGGVCAACGSRR